jgi:hypothetical protein
MADYREGQTATSKDGMSRVVYKGGMWVKDTSFQPQAVHKDANISAQDRTVMNAASAEAQHERDASRMYSDTEGAVKAMGTGPVKATMLDLITPDEDDSYLGKVFGSTVGALARAVVPQKLLNARDQLKTVNARVALEGSKDMKGSSSDKDTALMRLAGIGPSKLEPENLRIIQQARYNSGLAQARALLTNQWIAQNGSLANPNRHGTTFEQAKQFAERDYDRRMRMPSAPPRVRSGAPVTIDIHGNPIQ